MKRKRNIHLDEKTKRDFHEITFFFFLCTRSTENTTLYKKDLLYAIHFLLLLRELK